MLLKKHNFLFSKKNTNLRELHVLRRYHIEDREDYVKYNRLVGKITEYAHRLKTLAPEDPFRISKACHIFLELLRKEEVPIECQLSHDGLLFTCYLLKKDDEICSAVLRNFRKESATQR